MKNNLLSFRLSLKAERIKVRRTGIYLLSLIMGLGLPINGFVKQITRNYPLREDMLPFNYIERFFTWSLRDFSYFFLPVLIIIVVSRITYLDHKTGGWKLMETQPLPKFSIFFSKLLIILSSIALAIFTTLVFSVFFGWLLSKFQDVPVAASMAIPYGAVLQLFVRYFCAAMSIIALQYFLSVVIKSFIWPMIVGFTGVALVLAGAWNGWTPQSWNPFDILSNIANTLPGSDMGHYILFSEKISLLYGVLFLFIGYQWYKHKRFELAFISDKLKMVRAIIVVGLLAFFVVGLVKPNQMGQHGATVICGEVDSEEEFEKITVLDRVIGDTLAEIPIIDGEFHHKFNTNLLPDDYSLFFDNKTSAKVFFGHLDSLHIKLRFYNRSTEFTYGGTRYAENQIQLSDERLDYFNYLLGQNRYLDNPDQFVRSFTRRWEWEGKRKVDFKTTDNYITKEDFFDRRQMILAAKYMLYWEEFLKKRKAMYPGSETKEPPELTEIQNLVSMNREELLSNRYYVGYSSTFLIRNDTTDIDQNTKSLKAISALEDGSFKDKLLFKKIVSSMEDVSTSRERQRIVNSFINNIDNEYYREKIRENLAIIDKLSKGQPAPYFEGVNLEDDVVSLDDLKGKYVMIDVWATWCGPCWAQSPHFERHAIKYKNENIQFMAISIDAKKENWYLQAKSKSKTVLQLHVLNEGQFSALYNIKTIPRFIFLDPEGKIIFAEMVVPSEKAFEVLLRNELGLKEEI